MTLINKINTIWDFDGTITDETKEAEPFKEKFLELYSKDSGIKLDELHKIIDYVMPIIIKDSTIGWNPNGKGIIAPTTSSEYVLYTVLFTEINILANNNKLPDYNDTLSKMNYSKIVEIYLESYKHSTTAFKPDAKNALEKSSSEGIAVIVTNSSTTKVSQKLETLGINNKNIRLIGDAKKMSLQNDFPNIPEYVQPEGFPRPVYLRRGNYYNILINLSGEGMKPLNTYVIGDVYELDHSLPDYLGYGIILLDNKKPNGIIGVPNYEKEYIKKKHSESERKHLITSLGELL